MWLLGLIATASETGLRGKLAAILFLPIYFMAYSLAAVVAIWHLIIAPVRWRKIERNIARILVEKEVR